MEAGGRRRRPARPRTSGRRQIRLQRATGTRVELVERVRREADEQRSGDPPRREQPDRGDADQLEDAGRPAAREVCAKAALRAAPEIVGQAERRNGGDGGAVRHAHLPADERQAQAMEVDAERPAGIDAVAQLPRAVRRSRARSRPVARWTERELDLADAATRSARRRSSSAPRSRTRPQPGSTLPSPPETGARCPESGSRDLDAPEHADEAPGDALRQTEASPHPLRERGDGQVAVRAQQRLEVAGEIGVTQQQRPPATQRALRLTGLGPCRGAAGAGQLRPPPQRPRRCGRASRRPRRSLPRPGTHLAAAPRSSRSSPPRLEPGRGSSAVHPPAVAGSGAMTGRGALAVFLVP